MSEISKTEIVFWYLMVAMALLYEYFLPGIIGAAVANGILFPILEYFGDRSFITQFLGKSVWYVQWYSKLAFLLLFGLSGYGVRHIYRRYKGLI